MTNEPTQEQIKEFWEWCGWNLGLFENTEWATTWEYWVDPVGNRTDFTRSSPPPIDLNNLFKYAVLKAIRKLADIDLSTDKEAMYKLFSLWIEKFWSKTMSIEGALFWAIREVVVSEHSND